MMICELFQEGVRVSYTGIGCVATQVWVFIGVFFVVVILAVLLGVIGLWFKWVHIQCNKVDELEKGVDKINNFLIDLAKINKGRK